MRRNKTRILLEQLFERAGKLLAESYGDSLWFPEFDTGCFRNDYEEWKRANDINRRPMRKPARPVMRQHNTTERIGMTPYQKADADLKEMGIERPPLRNMDRPSKEQLEDKLASFTLGAWIRDTLRSYDMLADTNEISRKLTYGFGDYHINPRLLHIWKTKHYNELFDPDSTLDEYTAKTALIAFSKDDELRSEIKPAVNGMALNKFFYLIDCIVYDMPRIEGMYKFYRERAIRKYKEQVKDYEKWLDYKDNIYPEKLKEYNETRNSLIAKYKEEDVPEYKMADSVERYENEMDDYKDNLSDYEEFMKKYGKPEYGISEYIIIRYVYPIMKDENMVVLKNGMTYYFPDYIRGKRPGDLIYRNENIISFSGPYKEFLRKNGLGYHNANSIGGISATGSGWTYKKFITAWVLKHYTTIYDDVEFED